DFLPVSLSVISFQSVPPHCGPGAATRAPAGTAKAAARAATVAAAARTIRILGPPEGGSTRRRGPTHHRLSAGQTTRSNELPAFARQLHAEDAEHDEEREPDDPQGEHELRTPRLPQGLIRDLAPEDEEPGERGEPDDDHGGEICRALERPAERPGRHRDHAGDRHRGRGEPERPHGARVRFGSWTEPATTTPATTMSSSFSAFSSASTPTISKSA